MLEFAEICKIEILFTNTETYDDSQELGQKHYMNQTTNIIRLCSICKQSGHDKRKCPNPRSQQKKNEKESREMNVKSPLVFTTITPEMQEIIENICKMIASKPRTESAGDSVVLLRHKEVIQWLFGDLSFLPKIEKKNKTTDEKTYKVLEDKWGQELLRIRRPDLKLDKQWTNKFGEHLCEEIFTLMGKNVTKPVNRQHYQPDAEVDDAILEAKAQTFYTSGTAGEKILGSPFKYAEVPELYGKPLKIICMGGAEKVCRESYGNLPGEKMSAQKKKILDCFHEIGIEYIGATDILKSLVI